MTDVAAAAAKAEVAPGELEQFVALGLTGRRNALGDILDENVTKTSTKTFIEKLHRLQSTDDPTVGPGGSSNTDGQHTTSPDQSSSLQGNPPPPADKVS